jgi:competence protein ComFB
LLELKNSMERAVFRVLDEYLNKNPELCGCTKCRLDMAAVALNNLPPCYVVTEKGQLYAKVKQLESQFETDILLAVLQAAKKVGRNPQH